MRPMGRNQARRYLEEVRQVVASVGHQENYSVWSNSSECGTGAKSALYNGLVLQQLAVRDNAVIWQLAGHSALRDDHSV